MYFHCFKITAGQTKFSKIFKTFVVSVSFFIISVIYYFCLAMRCLATCVSQITDFLAIYWPLNSYFKAII